MTPLPLDTQKVLEILQHVAATTLDRQRRLGHDAVIWRDGQAIAIGDDTPAARLVTQDSKRGS
jgi:hypothetical protein